MIKKRKYSFRMLIYAMIALLVIFCVFATRMLVQYYSSALQDKAYERFENIFVTNNTNLSVNMMNAVKYMSEVYYYNTDLSVIANGSDSDEIFNGLARFARMLQSSLTGFSCVDGLFVYCPETDYFISATSNQEDAVASTDIRTMFRQHRAAGTLTDMAADVWKLQNINDKNCFIRIMRSRDIYVGLFVGETHIAHEIGTPYYDQLKFIWTDDNGRPFGGNMEPEVSLGLGLDHRLVSLEGTDYISVPVQGVFSGSGLYMLAPLDTDNISMKPLLFLMSMMSLMMVVLILMVAVMFSRLIIKPFKAVESVIDQVQSSDALPQLEFPTLACIELNQTMESFQHLCQEITQLQQSIFQEKTLRSRLEFARLKSQVAPHFLINCLCTLENMAVNGPEQKALFSQVIRTLSEHLRYSLCDEETVTLREELYYVENYIQLTQIRFPNCLTYELQVDEAIMDAGVFPLILLMLTENTIKYNMIMGETLHIQVEGALMERDGQRWLSLIHRDTGSGFSEEALQMLQLARDDMGIANGQHVGLYNIIKRLELSWPNAVIEFYNQDGAVVKLCLPYCPYPEGERQ